MMKKPKSSNLEAYKLWLFDLYLQAQKNGGNITVNDVRNCSIAYKIDSYYTGKCLRAMGILVPAESSKKSKKLNLQWVGQSPNDEMTQALFNEVYLTRHIEQTKLREERRRKRREAGSTSLIEVVPTSQNDEQVDAVKTNNSPVDAWCLKFPREKQYFSAFGIEVMRKIGALFCIDSTKELDGH